MKISKKAMKEIMKSETGSFRKKMDRVVEWSSTYFAKEYWSKMTESKDVRDLDFESKVIRILDLNSIDKWEDKQKAIHTCTSFAGPEGAVEFFEKNLQKPFRKSTRICILNVLLLL